MKNLTRLTAVFLVVATCSSLTARMSSRPVPFTSSCSAIAPAWIRGPSIQWLGSCVAGKADGLGILRVGLRAPFAFFVGRMSAGAPVRGILLEPKGDYIDAMGFDSRGEAISPDGKNLKAMPKVWAEAVHAAQSVADRFAVAGNHGSATYYRRFADTIKYGRPEQIGPND